MQLSAANLLIASQQIARGTPKPPADAQAQFAGALAKEKGIQGAGFEPMEFRAASSPAKAPAPPSAPAAPAQYSASTRLGANIDIRV